ncbi:MAG TPA: ribonuclease P protein component [Ktedonobacterales bacterium]
MRADAVEHDEQVERNTRSERFRRESRLRSSQDFQRVRRKGRRQQGQWLTLTYARRLASVAPTTSADAAPLVSRIGIAVNKRVGNAVTRNRIKRRLREAVRRRLWKTQPGWDMIVIARPEAASADYATLAGELQDLLTRARLLR